MAKKISSVITYDSYQEKSKDKLLITYKYRVKDGSKSLKHHLFQLASTTNFIWNYCNDIQQQAVKRHRPWLSAYDFAELTSGSSKLLNYPSQSIQAICEEYVIRRKQFNKPYLKFRTHRKNRNLPWIPFKASALKHDGHGVFTFHKLKLKTWYSRPIPEKAKIKTGSIVCDNLGHWFINIVLELPFDDEESLKWMSNGQNLTALDPGLNPIMTLSIEEPDGNVRYEEYEAEKWYRKSQEKLGKLQRYGKKKQAKRLMKRCKNRRKDYNHKLSSKLVKENHTIIGSDISLKKMVMGGLKGHAKAWHDVGYGDFRGMLRTKAKRHSVRNVEVNERELKSTQTCSDCGNVTGPKGCKGLSISVWTCSSCGARHYRNENSAENHRLAYKRSSEKV